MLANQVATGIAEGLAKMGVDPAKAAASGSGTLNIAALPEPFKTIVRAAYGDATGHIFLISADIAVAGVIAPRQRGLGRDAGADRRQGARRPLTDGAASGGIEG
ncbi:hypothetical protein ACWEPN_45465 [Nonomuraea wenchangensis]